MQLMKKWFIFLLIILIPVFGQKEKKEQKSKSFKKKNKLEFSNDQNTQDYLDMLEEAFYRVRESYVDSVNESEIIKSGIKGMMKPLDPYTRFLSGSSKDRLDMLRTGKYGGVGIQIGLRRDTLTVLTPFEDSPAYSEGIHSGDQILMIDSVKTKGMSLKDASGLIKGELGSVVVLTVYRPSSRKKIPFELTRANITNPVFIYTPVWDMLNDYVSTCQFEWNFFT
jgi:carboxyl-terminal processing protease